MSILITRGALLEAETTQPLTHARIGYQTVTRTATVSASDAAPGFPAEAAALPDTYQSWQPLTMPATWEVSGPAVIEADYLGIAGHNLGSVAATIYVETSEDEVEWETLVDYIPANDRPLMILFERTAAPFWRLRIEGDTAPTISVIYLGLALAMQRPIYGGHTPITLSRDTVIRPTVSERGQFLGRSIIRNGVQTSASWRHLTAEWYRREFDPFVLSARRYPFFFAWRPLDWPDEVAYAWTEDDIAPSNMGIRDLMEVGFSMQGIGGYE